MNYTLLEVKGQEYKCRLTAKSCVDLEKKLGENPLNIFINIGNTGKLPPLEDLLTILHCSLQTLEHSITKDSVYNLYDDYVEEGHTISDLIDLVMEIFKASGFIANERKN